MNWFQFALAILAVWRITHLLQAEDGPWDVIVRIRKFLGSSLLGSLMDCFYCLSVWIAIPFAFLVGEGWKEWLLLVPALSAGAILIERLTSHYHNPPKAQYLEDEATENDMLRREEKSTPPKHNKSTDN